MPTEANHRGLRALLDDAGFVEGRTMREQLVVQSRKRPDDQVITSAGSVKPLSATTLHVELADGTEVLHGAYVSHLVFEAGIGWSAIIDLDKPFAFPPQITQDEPVGTVISVFMDLQNIPVNVTVGSVPQDESNEE